jgi:hypothetical protein
MEMSQQSYWKGSNLTKAMAMGALFNGLDALTVKKVSF